MSTIKDTLEQGQFPDRVFYALGTLLDQHDFEAEQSYHRGRLARALASLHGSGTVAGLKVNYEPATDTSEDHLEVQPGLAIDRLGRLIEIPRPCCLRLGKWYDEIAARKTRDPAAPTKDTVDDLIQAWHGPPADGVVADVFLRFAPCPRGHTPAFATGPFDALNAVQASRVRDGAELKLVLRKEHPNPPLPENHWPDLAAIVDPAARRSALEEAIFDSWPQDETLNEDDPEPILEYPPDFDTTAVFLARVTIPAAASAEPQAAPARSAAPVIVNNSARLFVLRTRALARAHQL
jgi:hypothetical protein